MSSHPIEARYRILFANFHDSERGQLWNERLGSGFRSAIELLIPAFGRDLAMRAQDLDREQLKTLLTSILPARMAGRESFAGDLPDLLEDFLIFLAEEEGVARQWEWTSAVNENRAGFEDALAQSDRPRLVPPKSEPHRRPGTKLGRNDPCPCGSGKKYKSCCLKLG